MTDPRDIRMADIDWRRLLHDMGHSVHPLWWLVHVDPNRTPKPYDDGSWHDLTLGDVADKGERDILRHHGVGEAALQRPREIIDMAIAGTLPLKGAPAPDSLWPAAEGEDVLTKARRQERERCARLAWSEDEERPWEYWGEDKNVSVAQTVAKEIAAAIRDMKDETDTSAPASETRKSPVTG